MSLIWEATMAKPQTFHCHVTVKGQQCPCEFTLANAFTYNLRTLDQKAKSSGRDKATVSFAAKHAAICPWHAKMFSVFRRDIVRMDGVYSLIDRRDRSMAAQTSRRVDTTGSDRPINTRGEARVGLGHLLRQAGVESQPST